ncbi:hypothetical protein HPB52_008227 [Rhipicephalus sanguineus]|uniref:Tick transposon n=1 Tax=Rhipicephalus sanguineus TaxID=34632 RepID=A0A9D4QE88_RHISA|nr:hypothetical protein HPB52_008227 [Rhipicephalus sanguineus]
MRAILASTAKNVGAMPQYSQCYVVARRAKQMTLHKWTRRHSTLTVGTKLLIETIMLSKLARALGARITQPRHRGGFAFPDVAVTASILSLCTLLRVLNHNGSPAQTLARYDLGPSLRVLVPAGPINCGPQSSCLSTVYRALLAFYCGLKTTCPEVNVAEAKVVDTMAAVVLPLVPRHRHAPPRRCRVTFVTVWRCGWGLLPTHDRLQPWQVVRTSTCPNFVMVDTNRHATIECMVARLFGMRPMLVFLYRVCEGSRFTALLLVPGLLIFWRNRCEAVAGNGRRRALWPIFGRMRREILEFLSEELFFLGERECLRHWSCPFVGVER